MKRVHITSFYRDYFNLATLLSKSIQKTLQNYSADLLSNIMFTYTYQNCLALWIKMACGAWVVQKQDKDIP